jgi:hypothetical protein
MKSAERIPIKLTRSQRLAVLWVFRSRRRPLRHHLLSADAHQ